MCNNSLPVCSSHTTRWLYYAKVIFQIKNFSYINALCFIHFIFSFSFCHYPRKLDIYVHRRTLTLTKAIAKELASHIQLKDAIQPLGLLSYAFLSILHPNQSLQNSAGSSVCVYI